MLFYDKLHKRFLNFTLPLCARSLSGSHRRKVTQDFFTFLLQCLPKFIFASRIQLSLCLVEIWCTHEIIVLDLFGIM